MAVNAMSLMNNISLKSLLAVVLLSSTWQAWAGAAVYAHQASPEQYKVLTENDEVLVLEMLLQPSQADIMHSHRNETVYFEKGGTLRISLENGESVDVTVPDGHVMWHEAWTHQVTNIGDTVVKAIIVESKLAK
jgi:D-alanyl-D-alanine dipeptidase